MGILNGIHYRAKGVEDQRLLCLVRDNFFTQHVCISFIRTLGTHNKQIIKLHHVTHMHSISADISLIVKSRREI